MSAPTEAEGELLPQGIQRAVRFLCGCGVPEHFWQTLLDILEMAAAQHEGQSGLLSRWTSPDTANGPVDDPVRWFALYVVDGWGLLEHGCGICGSWLTDDGEEALAFLREHGVEWQRGDGHDWVDDDGCYWGS